MYSLFSVSCVRTGARFERARATRQRKPCEKNAAANLAPVYRALNARESRVFFVEKKTT